MSQENTERISIGTRSLIRGWQRHTNRPPISPIITFEPTAWRISPFLEVG